MSNEETKQAFNQLRTKKCRFVIYKVQGLNIYVDYVSQRAEVLKDLKKQLDDLVPAMIAYDYEFVTKDGRRSDKMYLISYIPENCNQVSRIQLARALKNFHESLPGTILGEATLLEDFDNYITNEEVDPTRL
eukprot:UN03555